MPFGYRIGKGLQPILGLSRKCLVMKIWKLLRFFAKLTFHFQFNKKRKQTFVLSHVQKRHEIVYCVHVGCEEVKIEFVVGNACIKMSMNKFLKDLHKNLKIGRC